MSTVAADRTVAVAKYHGTGNDFVVVDADEPVADRRAFASRVCDRTDGLGADGVLFLALESQFTPPRVVMTLVQPDGSTAPMCGNGARCAAAWAMARTGENSVMIDTQAGSRRAERIEPASEGSGTVDESRISVEMGRPSFEPATVPVSADDPIVDRPLADLGIEPDGMDVEAATLTATAVNTGVPHVVAFVDDVDSVDLSRLGPAVRHAEAFPRGTNLTVASPDRDRANDDRPAFRQRTYERGVEAETAACGTGAVAIATAAIETGRIDEASSILVRPPGGDLSVDFDDLGRAVLAGPVVREFETQVSVQRAGSDR
ncbi:diaminopimelate epimerase [Halovivax gelatinilyticus]|uniref:diaminopimelate epimerase n=1 Tax=Halovivax gelatinilyticus TaxID=2961597 RepID=UPI0020CA6AD1|nr:diaminopimelate epimerase [Halovivax gelatinilyticus]